jgi:hypothetical protein
MPAMFKQANFVFLALLLVIGSSCRRSVSAETGEAGAEQAEIGVPECDDYLSKYRRCIAEKVPSERKQSFEDALSRTRASWKTLAANPGARPGLPQACALARQTAQTTLKQYACSW